jgi:hypothetical protein
VPLYETLPCKLTPEERLGYGEELARESDALEDLKGEKKLTIQEIATRMNAAERRIRELTRKLTTGYEDRDVEVVIYLNTPEPGLKRVVRKESGQTVRTERMTPAEMQESFAFQEGQHDEQPETNPTTDPLG